MSQHKATLIQDIKEYLALITPCLDTLIQEHLLTGLTENEILTWIIAEEIELVYGLFSKRHIHNRDPHDQIHNRLGRMLPVTLSVLTRAYIKAPSLYGNDNEIELFVCGNDLFIMYHDTTVNYPQQFVYQPRI